MFFFLFLSAGCRVEMSDRIEPTNVSSYLRNYLNATVKVRKRKEIVFRFMRFRALGARHFILSPRENTKQGICS